MHGNEKIYPAPARIVLAAASTLRDQDLIERYGEEWLANLRDRTRRQQWRDAVSLLLRGARATRWAHHSRPRVVVASQATMALVAVIGMVLLFTTTPSLKIPLWGFAARNVRTFSRYDPSILVISLTAAVAIGLVLLTRRSWYTALGWLLSGIPITQALADTLPYNVCYKVCSLDPQGGHFQYLLVTAAGTGFADASAWWAVTASYCVLYAALILFVSPTIPRGTQVLAAAEVVVILYCTSPDWAYEYADRVGLTGLVPWLAGLLHVPTPEEITAVRVAPGIGFLVSMLIVVAAWRSLVIAKSLVLPPRWGAQICP